MNSILKRKLIISTATAVCAVTLVGGIAVGALNASAETQTLSGFECAGVSVNATEIGVRFQFGLTGDALAKKDCTTGVLYIPYDLYSGDVNNFEIGYQDAATTTFAWTENTETEDATDLVGYSYLDAALIPTTMYNRVLLVRGYIEDGDTIYYTAPIKTSMAYSAWQGIKTMSDLTEAQIAQLKAYMGPYTLTYGTAEGEAVSGMYYGDPVTGLPETIDGVTVSGWYWDQDRTDDIAAGDYATGSMNVYYKLQDFTVNGTLTCADEVDYSSVTILVNKEVYETTVNTDGTFSLTLEAGTYDLKFYCAGYVAYQDQVNVSSATELDVTLWEDTYDPCATQTTINGKTMAIAGQDYTGLGYGTFDREDLLDGSFTYSSGLNFGGRIFNNTSSADDYTYTITMNSPTATEGTMHGIAVTNGEYILSFQVEALYGQTMYSWYTKTGDAASGKTNHWINTNSGSISAKQPWAGSNTATLTLERTGDVLKLYAGTAEYLLLTVTATGITLNSTYASTNSTVGLDLSGFFGEGVQQAVGIASLAGNGKVVNYTVSYQTFTYYDVYSHRAINGKTMAIAGQDYTGLGYGTFSRDDMLDGSFTYSSASNFGGRIFNKTSSAGDYTYTITMNSPTATSGTVHGIAVTNGEYILSFQVEATGGQTMYSWYTKTGSVDSGKTNHWINTNAGSISAKQPWSGSNTATLTLERRGEELKLYAGTAKYLLLTVTKTGITLNTTYATTNPTVELDLSGFVGEGVEQAVGIASLAGNSKVVNYTVNYQPA